MPSPHRRTVRLAAVTACALSLPSAALAASASAATLTANKACYVNTDPSQGAQMILSGTGYTPGDSIEVTGTGVFATATVAANGDFIASADAPILSTVDPGTLATTLTATDETTGAPGATATVMSANLAVSTSPGSVRNVRKDKVTFSFSGFTPGKRIYGYYMRKKIVAKDTFSKAKGPCGTLKEKALLYPGGRPHNDEYNVTFESASKYSKKAVPRVTGKLDILHF